MEVSQGEDSDQEAFATSLFDEPSDYRRPPAPPTFITHQFRSGRRVSLRLVGQNPLWVLMSFQYLQIPIDRADAVDCLQGHYIWNGARILSKYIEAHPDLCRGKNVLELGAGAGLPGITALLEGGAKEVVLTDYPDEDLINNLRINADTVRDATGDATQAIGKLTAKGYLWGDRNIVHLTEDSTIEGFDVLLLADVNFNHHCHDALAESICLNLKRADESRAFVFFTPYRPWLLEKDMALFDVCTSKGLEVRKLLEEKMETLMFEKDPGCEQIRKTVFGYEISWASPAS